MSPIRVDKTPINWCYFPSFPCFIKFLTKDHLLQRIANFFSDRELDAPWFLRHDFMASLNLLLLVLSPCITSSKLPYFLFSYSSRRLLLYFSLFLSFFFIFLASEGFSCKVLYFSLLREFLEDRLMRAQSKYLLLCLSLEVPWDNYRDFYFKA